MDINIWKNLFFNILQYLIRESLLIVNQYNEKTCWKARLLGLGYI